MTAATLSEDEARDLIAARVAKLGGPGVAAKHWAVTAQMIWLVTKGKRRPTDAMLRELRLEAVESELRYRRRSR